MRNSRSNHLALSTNKKFLEGLEEKEREKYYSDSTVSKVITLRDEVIHFYDIEARLRGILLIYC
jgi:hypothetical protein